MLEIRPNCEHCNKDLPNTSNEAMICSFECTYCRECAIELFKNVCPSCGGNFTKRPIRPKNYTVKYPESQIRKHIPKNISETIEFVNQLKNIAPDKR